jgi:putative spermidine/putrescine transport system substrate-binding protein
MALLAVSTLLAVACGGGGSKGGSAQGEKIKLTYASFGGALQEAEEKAFIEPYEKAHPNIDIVYDIIDYSKLISQVESGNVIWDIADVGNDFGLTKDEKYIQKVPCGIVPCDQLQPDKYPTTGYRVAWSPSGLVLGYNTSKMPAGLEPQSWADFFDLRKFPGKRVSMADISSFFLEQALVAGGVPKDQLYPLDIDRALKKWDTVKDQTIFTTNYQACAETVATGDAVMGNCWSGRFFNVAQNGAPVKVQWKAATLNAGYFVVPKGAKHTKEAWDFIAYIVSAQNNCKTSWYIPYGPANKNALSCVKNKDWLGTTYEDEAIHIDDVWYDANRDTLAKSWQEWLSGVPVQP